MNLFRALRIKHLLLVLFVMLTAMRGELCFGRERNFCQEFLKKRERHMLLEKVHALNRPRCFPFNGGFFALTVKDYKPLDAEGDRYRILWNLAWVKDKKVSVLQLTQPDAVSNSKDKSRSKARTRKLEDVHEPGDDRSQTHIEWVADLDGDGTAEIFLLDYVDHYEDLEEAALSIWTVRGNSVIPYPHDPVSASEQAVPGRLVADIDADGRPDIYVSGAYHASKKPACGNIDEAPAVPPIFVLHGLPDGRFSGTDAVAQAALKKWCPQRPDLVQLAADGLAEKQSSPYSLLNDFSQVIVCARAYGISADAVLEGIRPACAAAPDGCIDGDKPKSAVCPSWLGKLAAVPPPILLHE